MGSLRVALCLLIVNFLESNHVKYLVVWMIKICLAQNQTDSLYMHDVNSFGTKLVINKIVLYLTNSAN